MVGIGQITTRVAELIRSALPFAIVDNGTNFDGTPRGRSTFSRLVAYNNVQEAINAGWKQIKIAKGRYAGFVIGSTQGDILIEGQGKYAETIIDGGITKNAIQINAAGVTVRDLQAVTTQDGGGAYFPIQVGDPSNNPYNVVIDSIRIPYSDGHGIYINHGSVIRISNCHISNCDTYGIYIHASSGSSNQNEVIGCVIDGTLGAYCYNDANGSHNLVRDNYFSGAAGYTVNTDTTKLICDGNRMVGDASYGYALRVAGSSGFYSNNYITGWTIAYYYDTGSGNTYTNNKNAAAN